MIVSEKTTIAARATPSGRGGVGIIRISGPEALNISQGLSPDARLPKPRHAQFCVWIDAAGAVLDQGLRLYFPAPHSYTGEDVVELHGHGSPVLLEALLKRLFQLGCKPAQPGEFTRRAVEHGKMDLTQAEAVAACIDAATLRAGKQAQHQLAGEFGKKIDLLMQELTGVLAQLEASIDFSEDDLPELFLPELGQDIKSRILFPIHHLLASARLGERLFSGATMAIIGAPNVGKSSILNLLCGRDRAIVSDIAGTTRDILEVDFEIRGIPVRLVDTAGIRHSHDRIEQEGVRRAKEAAERADLVLFVADASRPETWHTEVDADVRLMNKTDLSESTKWPPDFLPFSALKKEGLETLVEFLGSELDDLSLAEEDVLVTRERHRQALIEARESIEAAYQMLVSEAQLDLAAMELRRGWMILGSILGIGDVEVILDRIFADFCIGK